MAKFIPNPNAVHPQDLLCKKLIAIGFQMEADIKRSMKVGIGLKGRRGHRASAPGEPPAVDTGRLRASMSVNWTGSGMIRGMVESKASPEDGVGVENINKFGFLTKPMFFVYVGTNVPYADFLEYGTSKMAPRPFLRPVYDKYRIRIASLLRSGGGVR